MTFFFPQDQLHNMFSVYGIVSQLKILTRPGHGTTGEVPQNDVKYVHLFVYVRIFVHEYIDMYIIPRSNRLGDLPKSSQGITPNAWHICLPARLSMSYAYNYLEPPHCKRSSACPMNHIILSKVLVYTDIHMHRTMYLSRCISCVCPHAPGIQSVHAHIHKHMRINTCILVTLVCISIHTCTHTHTHNRPRPLYYRLITSILTHTHIYIHITNLLTSVFMAGACPHG